jgi:hypothetical protein
MSRNTVETNPIGQNLDHVSTSDQLDGAWDDEARTTVIFKNLSTLTQNSDLLFVKYKQNERPSVYREHLKLTKTTH